MTTTEIKLTEGKHYWEVELLSEVMSNILIINIFVGISRPNLDPAGEYYDRDCTDGWFIYAYNGALSGNGKQGDRVGVLLDLDTGSLRFFKNGVEHGPGYPAGSVTGPVVAAVQMHHKGCRVRLLPNAEAPAGV